MVCLPITSHLGQTMVSDFDQLVFNLASVMQHSKHSTSSSPTPARLFSGFSWYASGWIEQTQEPRVLEASYCAVDRDTKLHHWGKLRELHLLSPTQKPTTSFDHVISQRTSNGWDSWAATATTWQGWKCYLLLFLWVSWDGRENFLIMGNLLRTMVTQINSSPMTSAFLPTTSLPFMYLHSLEMTYQLKLFSSNCAALLVGKGANNSCQALQVANPAVASFCCSHKDTFPQFLHQVLWQALQMLFPPFPLNLGICIKQIWNGIVKICTCHNWPLPQYQEVQTCWHMGNIDCKRYQVNAAKVMTSIMELCHSIWCLV